MEDVRILVVDDMPEHIRVITEILLNDNKKYLIYAATNGKAGVDLAKIKLPHIIIMDWDMPIMNGIEATRTLKAEQTTKDIPIIIASGLHVDSLSLKEAMSFGAIDFVRKPIDRIELIARVHSMLQLVESFQENIRQKEINFKQEIAFKTQELSAHAFSIAKQNEFLIYLVSELKKLLEISNAQSKKQIYNLVENTNNQLNENAWETFEQQFAKVYSDFYHIIRENYPSLSPSERKLCALLKLNLSSKEIANLTFQEPSSVDVARYRLRQKLGLDKDDNLVGFIMNLG